MLFNVDKYKVMHFEFNNIQAKCNMNSKFLEEATEERDLAVTSNAVVNL